ncbi:MAG TPA: sodium:calcium antiporter, partial [Acidobacteriota bacterium]|nr:sodium:calcium antiporter [Acidobacteriota bacterium]
MSILLLLVFLVICLAAIIKSADFFIESCAKLGIKLGISTFAIGATLVALGSSLPELAIAVSGSL